MAFSTSMQGSSLSIEDIVQLYANEAVSYYWIRQSELYEQVVERYQQVNNPGSHPSSISIPEAFRHSRFLDFSVKENWFYIIEAAAQMAVTCHLMQGCRFENNADNTVFKEISKQAVHAFVQQHGEAGLNRLAYMLESVEGVRTEQLIRCLGLLSLPPQDIHLLSLGSGSGYKELEGIYCKATVEPDPAYRGEVSLFKVIQQRARHTLLVDPEPGYKTHYDALTQNSNDVLALNTFVQDAIPAIKSKIDSGQISKRNVVAAYRMDPVMIPDVENFFRQLKEVITEQAHLTISIGSGNDVNEFSNRLNKMNEIRAYLNERGIPAYSMKLHAGNTIEQGFEKPVYGYGAFATYEIIYCDLHRDKIS